MHARRKFGCLFSLEPGIQKPSFVMTETSAVLNVGRRGLQLLLNLPIHFTAESMMRVGVAMSKAVGTFPLHGFHGLKLILCPFIERTHLCLGNLLLLDFFEYLG